MDGEVHLIGANLEPGDTIYESGGVEVFRFKGANRTLYYRKIPVWAWFSASLALHFAVGVAAHWVMP